MVQLLLTIKSLTKGCLCMHVSEDKNQFGVNMLKCNAFLFPTEDLWEKLNGIHLSFRALEQIENNFVI